MGPTSPTEQEEGVVSNSGFISLYYISLSVLLRFMMCTTSTSRNCSNLNCDYCVSLLSSGWTILLRMRERETLAHVRRYVTTLLRKIAVAVEGDGQSCAARLRCRAASDHCYTSVDLWSRTSTPASPAAGDIVRPQVSCNDSEIFHFIYRNIPLIHTGRGEIYHSASHCSSRRLYCNGSIGRVYMGYIA